MAKESTYLTRCKAVAQLKGGQTQSEVARGIGVSIRMVRRWWKKHQTGQELTNTPGRGRKPKLSKAAKITISKSLTKRAQSTRKLATRLTSKGHKVSHETVRKHMRQSLKVLPFKPQLQPRLTAVQKANRLKFCRERKSWGIDEWRRVLFSDESPFELFHLPNCQNDWIWACDKEEVSPTFTVKHPLKIQVWGLMSFRALSELHVLPEKQMVTGAYYVDEVLEKSLLPTLKRTGETGSTLQRKLLPDMSMAIFQQDGAPAHTSKVAIKWLENNLNSFWGKGVWPGNSPDLSPIENLWAIVQEELKKLPDATDRETLIKNVKTAWANISPDILDNLICCMPERIKKCIKVKGGYIGKWHGFLRFDNKLVWLRK